MCGGLLCYSCFDLFFDGIVYSIHHHYSDTMLFLSLYCYFSGHWGEEGDDVILHGLGRGG